MQQPLQPTPSNVKKDSDKEEKDVDQEYMRKARHSLSIVIDVDMEGQPKYLVEPDLHHHITVKMFDPDKDDQEEVLRRIHKFGPLPVPDPSKFRLEASVFHSSITNFTYYNIKIIEGLPEEYFRFYEVVRDMGISYPKYVPHITIKRSLYEDITSGKINLATMKIRCHAPVLNRDLKALKFLDKL